MRISDVLSVDRVAVSCAAEGLVHDKPGALSKLADLLATGAAGVSSDTIRDVLEEREQVQSTGVGEGVAVPHGAVANLERQLAAVLVCPEPIAFDAIDGAPVSILFALVGPPGAPAQHLKVLARVSRFLRKRAFRDELRAAPRGADVFALLVGAEGRT